MKTKTNRKYSHKLVEGDRIISGSVTYTVKSVRTVPGLRRQAVVIDTVEGPSIIHILGSIITMAEVQA